MKLSTKIATSCLLALIATPGVLLANEGLAKLSADPANWAMQAGDFANHRYSELSEIKSGHVESRAASGGQ